jgi:hypothetical protein
MKNHCRTARIRCWIQTERSAPSAWPPWLAGPEPSPQTTPTRSPSGFGGWRESAPRQVDRLGADVKVSLVTPQNRDTRGATARGGPGGNNRATVRSALITLASLLTGCLHEPTTVSGAQR